VRDGLILCLMLLAWSPVLACADTGSLPGGVAFGEDARATAGSGAMTTPPPGAMPPVAGDPMRSPTPLQPDPKENAVPAASKLSPRLRHLANLAATGSLPADTAEQDRLLGLAESGAGSLSRDAAGDPIVDARVTDTSAEMIAALTALPANVLSIAPEYATVTLAIAPERLNDLANIDAVQYVAEVIRPEGNPSGGSSGGGIAPSVP
jgi:hypothetical protein